jgi:hypothetical protein
LQLLAVGAVGGLVIGCFLVVSKKIVQEYLYKQDHEVTRESLVNIELEESQDQYQSLRSLFEKLLTSTSSDTSNDAEDIAAMSQANRNIVSLINETLQINPEKDFAARIKKKVKLFAAIRDYLDYYWDFIPQEAHINLVQIAAKLNISAREATYAEKLDRKLYRFYQGIIFSFMHKLAEKLHQSGISECLWEIKDRDGKVVDKFPMSADEKAIERIKDVDNILQWEKLPRSKENPTDEEVEKYMGENGLS